MSKITVKTQEKRFATAPSLYGVFFEDINRSADGGLYPEMLRNRSYEDSLIPDRCTISEDGATYTTPGGWAEGKFNNGEGQAEWATVPPTPIPAWYATNADMSLDTADKLNAKRLTSLKVDFSAGGSIHNIGFLGMAFKKGTQYNFYMFAKSDAPVTLDISLVAETGAVVGEAALTVKPGAYERYDCTFTATGDDTNGKLVITAKEAGTVWFGFTSLMPADTYKGNGLRNDLMEMLAGTNATFFRFPGGCIVEGFSLETAMRFSNTVGPVWERPSQFLMWNYRTTNGLGYHEYLQLCEDLNFDPMYVVNCGLTCQFRGPELFEGEALEEMLQEVMDAIEYAIGDKSTPMGQKRAQAGHPEPFKMKYIEIGNEQWGPEYSSRYKKFYDALKTKYPKIKYIYNIHSELDARLPTDISDEHYYNTPEFFIKNMNKYDDYDRHGPDIFVGEYAVTGGEKKANLYCALAEAMFLLGIENNQDIVTLTAYAPLFQNSTYRSWYPNLIVFDNHRVYGIPSYHAISMLARNRGANVVASCVEETNKEDLPGVALTATTEGDDIIIKIINVKGEADSMEIDLDCSVQPDYTVQILTADDPHAANSFDDPLAVSPKTLTRSGAAQTFIYDAPPYSLNILTLKK